MRHIRWIPFTFLAGVHGFAIFAPYVAVMLAVGHFAGRRQRIRLAGVNGRVKAGSAIDLGK
jgi:hypothetical protein